MADKKISELAAAAVAALTDEYLIAAGGFSRKVTGAQILAMIKAGFSPFGTDMGLAKSLTVGGATLQPDASFARTGPAWAGGVEYPANTPRFVDPSPSGTRGVLVEEAHGSIGLYSAELDNAWWTKTRCSITPNTDMAPDGTMTMDTLVEDTTASNNHILRRDAIFTVGQPGTIQFYAKAKTRSQVWAGFATSFANTAFFDLAAGTVAALGGSVTASIEPVPGYPGIYRCSVSIPTIVTGANNLFIGPGVALSANYTGDGTSGIGLWGVMPMAKAYPLSYIPTVAATVTMNAETLTVPTAGLLTPSAGSVIIKQWVGGQLLGSGTAHNLLDHNAGASFSQFGINKQTAANQWRVYSQDGAGTLTTATYTGAVAAGWRHFGYRISAAELSLWIESAKVASAASPKLPTTLASNLYIGSDSLSAKQVNQPAAWVYFYNRALSDAEMAAATLGNPPPDFTAYYDWTQGTLNPEQAIVKGMVVAEKGLAVKAGPVALPANSVSDLALSTNVQLKTDAHDLPTYAKAALTGLTHKAGRMVFVTDLTGGAEPVVSDGTNWRRLSDRTVAN